ncbi:VOC family protein [Winogradskyella sp.]|uniref:VOC family protein n=1 Tax=Winogradskyella sp. TaxID=1883156 RepID=UPI00345C7F26
MKKQKMAICLWYDNQAEDAANFYTSIFEDSEILRISRFGKEGFEIHGKEKESVMTVDFKLNGMRFLALNGGPKFKFNEQTSEYSLRIGSVRRYLGKKNSNCKYLRIY